MQTNVLCVFMALTLFLASGCQDHRQLTSPSQLRVEDVATNLAYPIGLATDDRGRVWVTETAAGRVSVITPDGRIYPAITGFNVGLSPENAPDGLNHLLYKDGLLYILHGTDEKLYIANVASFTPGDQPLSAATLAAEPIGQFVLDYRFAQDTDDTNLYNLTFGPDGDLFMADAGANAIIRRSKTGALSVFATVPGIPNPTPVGPPVVQSVPTGIVFDGDKFLITTLLGFPFPAGRARVYQADLNGNVTLFQDGFTSLVDIALGPDRRPIVLEIGPFGQQGPLPNAGRLIQPISGSNTVLLQNLNRPTALEFGVANTYYINSLADRKVQRVTY